jgi:Tol biopolymer transport system component
MALIHGSVRRRNMGGLLPAGIAFAAAVFFLSGAARAQKGAPAAEKIFSRTGHRWYEDLAASGSISSDGKWAILPDADGSDLISLITMKADAARLKGPLDTATQAYFCGKDLLRQGKHGDKEEGWYAMIEDKGLDRVLLKPDAIPFCSADGNISGYFRKGVPDIGIYVGSWKERRHVTMRGVVTGAVLSPDADEVYVMVRQADGASSLVKVLVDSGRILPLVSGLDADPRMSPLSISPDGKRLYLSLAGEKAPDAAVRQQPEAARWLNLYSFDLASKRFRRIFESAVDKIAPVEAGGHLFWAQNAARESVVALPAAGGAAHEVAGGAQVPSWSRDGQRIGYVFGNGRRVDWALNLDAWAVAVNAEAQPAAPPAAVIAGNHEDFEPEWSPDGKWIAFHSHRAAAPVATYDAPGSSDDIWIKKAADPVAAEIRLTDFGWEAGSPSWSPDGRRLVFSSWEKGGKAGVAFLWIVTVSPETGASLGRVKLALPAQIVNPQWAAWSPKSNDEIAVADESAPGERVIWVISADGKQAQPLVKYKSDTYGGLDWTPDGQSIIYSALQDGRMQLFSMPRAGGKPVKISNDTANLLHPRVSPDGRWIAATRLEITQEIWKK